MATRIDLVKDGEQTIWRYMDLPRFLSMLEHKRITLCRADRLPDQFEGSFTKKSIEEFRQKHNLDLGDWHRDVQTKIPQWSYVTCWHASESESEALWRIYGASSIAVTSTVVRLSTVIFESDEYHYFDADDPKQGGSLFWQGIRRVNYIDYKTEHPDLEEPVSPLCYKRKAFSYENEIRGIRQELPFVRSPFAVQIGPGVNGAAPPGPAVTWQLADMKQLITAVYVPPRAEPWVQELLRAVMNRYGLKDIPCRQSSLDDLPEFGVPRG